jgi:hypothetical protein
MKQENWQRVEELFHSALERTPDARQSFLDGVCGIDSKLRRQVELLLAQEAQAGSFMEVPLMVKKLVVPIALRTNLTSSAGS